MSEPTKTVVITGTSSGFGEGVALGGGVQEREPVSVYGAEQHEQTSKVQQCFAFGSRAGAELKGWGVFEKQQQSDFSLFDEFLAVSFAKAGGHVPVDVPYVVAEFVLHDLVELHSLAAEG